MKKKYSFWRRNGLSIVLLSAMLLFLIGQFYMGWKEHNEDLVKKAQPPVSAGQYVTSGHFIQATFENWEREFLQMAIYVILIHPFFPLLVRIFSELAR